MNQIKILLLAFILIGCENSDENSLIIGTWKTNNCEQLSYSNNQLTNVWAKSTYTIDSRGSIYTESISYSDSNCITKSNDITTTSRLVAILSELGPVTTSQGIEANKISITFNSAPSPIVTTSGYYKVTNNQLCLSQSFHFDAGGFGISQTNDTRIDFNHCLTKLTP